MGDKLMNITSRASDYALLMLIHMATLPEGESTNVKKIASHLGLSLRFLANIAGKLTTAHIIESQRGIGGGIKLKKDASTVSIRDVIEAVDGPVQTMFCQNDHENCSHLSACNMKHFWDDLQGLVVHKLTATSIAHLAAQQNKTKMSEATYV
ncbi:Rrf2 family transcriptional regulator [bacterium]|nr:Rrf2 family transcriptional regulator [bacterium]